MTTLTLLILIAGVLHLALLSASALTPRVLAWNRELNNVSSLTRQLVLVHGAFIVLVIVGFGVLSLTFAATLAAGAPLARGLSAFMALFWASRLAVQLFYFDARAWLTTWWLHVGYRGLTFVFAYFTLVYSMAALQSGCQ